MNRIYLSRKSLALNLFILAALLMMLAYPTGVVQAATYTASNQTELDAAILAANNNTGADTIEITADITLSSALTNNITSEITIEGAGFSLDGVSTYRVLYVVSGGNLTLNNVAIANGNAATGGGIYNAGTLTINHCTFDNNSAGGNGGGVYVHVNAVLTINNSTFSGNSAMYGGGVLNLPTATTAIINNSTFSGNSADNDGGGLRINGPLTINNSTFSGNSAANGGGVYSNSTLTLNRSIISGNTATSSGDEVYEADTVNANNYNVFAHGGITDAQAFSGFTPGANDYSASSSGNNIALSSILNTTLADNGGPTETHALPNSSSPAIDHAPDCSGTDQRGAARDYDGDGGSSSNECDSGAYEYRAPTQQCGIAVDTDYTVENVTFNFSSLNGLSCVTVEEMEADHLAATGPGSGSDVALLTGNWWHITGDGTGFSVSITLPYTGADTNSRVCEYPGGSGGYGWDCNASNTTYVADTSVTRSGINSFSDWAAGDNVGPTAVIVSTINAQSTLPLVGALLVFAIVFAGGLLTLKKLNRQRS